MDGEVLKVMDAFAEISRIKEVRSLTDDTLLVVPNFPQRRESDGFIHGPDVIQSGIEAVETYLRTAVHNVLSVDFRSPINANNPLLISRHKTAIRPQDTHMTGEFVVKDGTTLSFGLFKGNFGDGSETLTLPKNPTPLCPVGDFTINNMTEIKWDMYVPGLSLPKLKALITIENLLRMGGKFIRAYSDRNPLKFVKRSFFTRLYNLDLTKLYEDEVYTFSLKLKEAVDKNGKTFLNFFYSIEDFRGNQATTGNLSLCLVWYSQAEIDKVHSTGGSFSWNV